MKRAPQSILFSLPLMVMGAFVVMATISFVYLDYLHRKNMIEAARSHLMEDADRLARQAEHDLPTEPEQVEHEIVLHGREADNVVTALIDAGGIILFAQRPDLKGRPFTDALPSLEPSRFSKAVRANIVDIETNDRNMTVLLPFVVDQGATQTALPWRGAIYLDFDAESAMARSRYEHLLQHLPALGLALGFAMLLNLWLQRHLVGPLGRISEVSRRVTRGELAARAPIGGIREVAELGEHFNIMAMALEQEFEHQRLNARVFETVGEAIMVTDADANIVAVNPAFCRITGYSQAEVLGQNPRILKSDRHDRAFHQTMRESLDAHGTWAGEVWNRRKNGEVFPEWQTISSIKDPYGRVTQYVAVFADLSEIRKAQAAAEHLSWRDGLTGLANRALFLSQLAQTLATAHHEGRYADVLLLDLDRFKDINEARGLALGDALLKVVAECLTEALRPDDLLARLDSDEFAVLLPRLAIDRESAGREALAVTEKLRGALRTGIRVDGEQFPLDASIGIALFPESVEETASDVLRQADVAMHQAKAAGGGGAVFFEAAMGQTVRERYQLERELRQGIEEGQLRLFLQPQVDVAGRQVGAEALVRWLHPEKGLLPPGVFIPLAECSDLVVTVDRWVLAAVCRLLVRLDAEGRSLRISVNISPRHFERDDFVDQITRLLTMSGADPAHLVLEVTEGLVIGNFAHVIAKMTALSSLGIHFSMDDFGTGYSSLAYLKRLPIHELKIDKSFIDDVTTDPNDAALVETILAVAQHLRLQVVAEGVETRAQADFLNAHGAVIHQGYFFGRPEPVEVWMAQLTREAPRE